uniref:DmX-like protein 2 (Trinotate prediction) n=1 Tax=Myxobolus squamalis TaxID=59785 RepID=A0A6B2G7W7_MYXSQ
MPPRSRLTCSFLSHEHGCSTVAYSSLTQSLIIGGRKGSLSIFDLRAQKMLTSIHHAHDTPISCLSVDQNIIATGSMDGVVKTWSLITSGSKNYIEPCNTFLPKPTPTTHKIRDSRIYCIRIQERYLFSTSNGVLSIRILDH